MEYSISNRNNVIVLKLVSDITVYQSERFKEALTAVKKEKGQKKRVVIDLEKVGYIDGLALGALTDFSREIIEDGGDVKIANVNDDIKLIFDLTHLSKVYEIHNNAEEAVKSFS